MGLPSSVVEFGTYCKFVAGASKTTVLPSGSNPLLSTWTVYSTVSPMLNPVGGASVTTTADLCRTGTGNGRTVVPASIYGLPGWATSGSSPQAAVMSVPSTV